MHVAFAAEAADEDARPQVEARNTVSGQPALISRLPPLSRLEADAHMQAKASFRDTCRRLELARAMEERNNIVDTFNSQAAGSPTSPHRRDSSSQGTTKTFRPVELYELLRAIERKDLETIFNVRNTQFGLLLEQQDKTTPLLHAMRLGKSHRDIAILLTGALSRYVNNLPETSAPDKATKETLRQLRANLKLAISASLEANETGLISSYLQVLVMSEGERWITDQAHSVAIALRSGQSARPVDYARRAVLRFATTELKQLNKEHAIASVSDYVSNATIDLLLMGTWELISEQIPKGGARGVDLGPLPLYQFGRDDRLYRSFSDRVAAVFEAPMSGYQKLPKSTRQYASTLQSISEKHTISSRVKVDELMAIFDASL